MTAIDLNKPWTEWTTFEKHVHLARTANRFDDLPCTPDRPFAEFFELSEDDAAELTEAYYAHISQHLTPRDLANRIREILARIDPAALAAANTDKPATGEVAR